ncbi:ABC transporter substrate-binding protein [Paenibacillus harenae]|uniref:Iron complex transport system substrate-binding protein n=1 Tax=Paenibacillus harenae TaxID=306543 RepID=A0ABT9U0T5_PAEHA|nr:ABC transporter substrate-binding protein [Paenibacillus harenae]MDQ0061541.1 iron complex transport system substrate-binding protein [Paenibacillus harenae]MDQ0113178.1 iron complex transport system substrate-binding protein [Paenibacillus harenae]
MALRNKKFVLVLISLMVMSLWLAACGGSDNNKNAGNAATNAPATEAPGATDATEAGEERTLVDGLGNEVKIPANPQRIIASYLEDHLVALGVKPVAQWQVPNGVQDYLQGDLAGVPTLAHDLPFEAVTALEPDLIIVGMASTVEGKYDQYNKIAPTFVLGDEINNNWREALLKVGEVLGKDAEAKKALETYDAKAKEAKEKIAAAAPGESAAAIWLVGKNFYMVSEDLSTGSLLYGELGIPVPEVVKEISATEGGNWKAISLEKLAELDADHLFLINSDKDSGSEALNAPIWKEIPAVKSGNVYEYPSTSSWLYGGTVAFSQVIDDVLESIVK